MLRYFFASLFIISIPAVADELPSASSSATSAAISQAASAKESMGSLSLEDCFKATLKQSESFAAQKELVVQAKELYNQAIGSVLPNVQGSALWFLEDGHSLPNTIPQTAQQNTYKVTLNQPLFDGMKEYAALRQTKEGIAYNDLSVQAAALNLYGGLAQNFYLVLSLEKDISTQEEEVDLYNQRIEELKRFVQIGRSRIPEILTVQAAQASLLAEIEATKGQIAVAREGLAFYTGLSNDTSLSDSETLPSQLPDLSEFLAKLGDRPDIKAGEGAVEMVKEDVNLAEGGHYPTLDLTADYYFQRPEGLTQNVDWDGQLFLNVPLFSGGVVSAQVRQAESQYRSAQLGFEALKRMTQEAIQSAYDNLKYDQSQVSALLSAADLNKKNYDAEREDYSHGLVTNQDVLTALTSFEDAKRALDKEIFASKGDYANLLALTAQIQVPDSGESAQ